MRACELKISLPWPLKDLSPNARGHWAKKHRAAKKYRHECSMLAGMQVSGKTNPARGAKARGSVDMYIDFYPPTRAKRDDDNLVAQFKSGRDGLADALGCDDDVFRIHPFLADETVKGGLVVVTIKVEGACGAEGAEHAMGQSKKSDT